MIHGISANFDSFREVRFTPGLNVILAERTRESSQKNTRNGVGKSTLIQILDFCLGGTVKRGEGIFVDSLRDWAFTIDMTLAGNRIRVTRSMGAPNQVTVDGPTDGWAVRPLSGAMFGENVYSLGEWRTLLGWGLFGLPAVADGQSKYHPTFRSLISYFVRLGPDAYNVPFRYFSQQQTWSIQVNVAFLLGLNWEYAMEWQRIRDQEDGLRAMSKALAAGALDGLVGSIGELETERVRLEAQTEGERQALTTFRVHPQYEAIEQEATRLTTQIHGLTNKNAGARWRLAQYEASVSDEGAPSEAAIESVYREAGLIFSAQVKHTLAEVRTFHSAVIRNRREFVSTEIDRLRKEILGRESEVQSLSNRRAEMLMILNTHGALPEMVRLQDRHAETQARLENLQQRLASLKYMKEHARDLRTAKTELTRSAELDHEDRRPLWSKSVRLFNEFSQALYETPGNLVIDIDEGGYRFAVEIERSGSEGIAKMKVFCFDLMLSQLWAGQTPGIRFLVHDSTIQDGVDSRQRALSLERAAAVAEREGTQYICALNSDMLPNQDFSREFHIARYVRLQLGDKEPSDSLLGIRF